MAIISQFIADGKPNGYISIYDTSPFTVGNVLTINSKSEWPILGLIVSIIDSNTLTLIDPNTSVLLDLSGYKVKDGASVVYNPAPNTPGTPISVGDTTNTANRVSLPAANNVQVGDLVYIDNNGIAQKSSTTTEPAFGIVVGTSQSLANIQVSGSVTLTQSLITGADYYLSSTPGQMTAGALNNTGFTQYIGFALNTNNFWIEIDKTITVL